MSKVITLLNRKGGCSKTSTAFSLAVELSKNANTICIDLDDQANLTSWAGITELQYEFADYLLDKSITEEYIEYILRQEDVKRNYRDVYQTKHAIIDFRAGLKKFYSFVNSDYEKRMKDTILGKINQILESQTLNNTQKETIIQARIGQGIFRRNLIKFWNGCSLSGNPMTWFLNASNIKPWRDSDNAERIDVFNGLLLTPNYDKLFDKGYITFNNNGKILISSLIEKEERLLVGLKENMTLKKVEDYHKKYLIYHKAHCFLG